MSIITPMSNNNCELEGCERDAFQMFYGVIVCLYHFNRGTKPQTFGTYLEDGTFGYQSETVPFDACICDGGKVRSNCWAEIHN